MLFHYTPFLKVKSYCCRPKKPWNMLKNVTIIMDNAIGIHLTDILTHYFSWRKSVHILLCNITLSARVKIRWLEIDVFKNSSSFSLKETYWKRDLLVACKIILLIKISINCMQIVFWGWYQFDALLKKYLHM